ncbi:DUF1841 family protein [Candidatus Magnetaquicoccus inordinatus]|uniref:DUF1841 family protein n=1 Tax=Candidatus Magnetaquicoccus inordinatus TaxID=2496818 RepID=UPI001D0F231D|nr:DUF1841 family protein [Candidatus Magnetaquicoccus inordinatus]
MDSVDMQLRTSQPPEVQETYRRLCAQGYSDQDARQLIATVMANESFMIQVHHDTFDRARYVAMLRNLPRIPFAELKSSRGIALEAVH